MIFFPEKNKIFNWTGENKAGKYLSGEIEAVTPTLAKYYLEKRGILATTIKKKSSVFKWKKKQAITSKELSAFFKQLSTMLNAGIAILACFEILESIQTNLTLKNIISEIKNDLINGKQLNLALKKFPAYFNSLECSLVFIGEQSGTLDKNLILLSESKERNLLLKKQIIQALFYPGLIAFTALIVCFVMLAFVVPRFEELFINMHASLPHFTLIFIHLSHFFKNHVVTMLILTFLIILFLYFAKKIPGLKNKLDLGLLALPLVNRLTNKILLARFTRHTANLYASGINLIESLKLVSTTLINYKYTHAIQCVQKDILNGRQLYFAMQQQSVFPSLMVQMIKIAEESGTLDKMLFKLADQYEAEINHLVKNLGQLLEPLIMIVLGVLIGGLVIAMYLPIFKLGTII